jgi:hypothetical protein
MVLKTNDVVNFMYIVFRVKMSLNYAILFSGNIYKMITLVPGEGSDEQGRQHTEAEQGSGQDGLLDPQLTGLAIQSV